MFDVGASLTGPLRDAEWRVRDDASATAHDAQDRGRRMASLARDGIFQEALYSAVHSRFEAFKTVTK